MNLNHITVSGNLTRDPEIKSVGADRVVASFTLAQNRKWKTADGESREEVLFIDAEAWGRTAELVGQYLTKGTPTVIEGRLKLDTWQDKETGSKRSRVKIFVELVHLLPRNRSDTGQDMVVLEDDPRESTATPQQTPAPIANARTPGRAVPSAARQRTAAPLGDAPPF